MNLVDYFFYILLPMAFAGGSPEPERVEIQISPETTHIVAPLGFDGRVDYITYFNLLHSRGVAPAQNSAVLYWRAIGRQEEMSDRDCRELERLMGVKLFDEPTLKFVTEREFIADKIEANVLGDAQEFYRMQSLAMFAPWPKEQIPLIAEWVKLNEPTLLLVEQAGRLPRYYMPQPHTRLMAEASTNYIQRYRSLLRLLNCRVMLRAGQGDYEGASRDLISMFHLAAKTGEGGMLIDGLLASSMYSISESTLERFINQTDVSAEILSQLQLELAALPPAFDLVSCVSEAERFSGLDMLQYAGTAGPEIFLNEFCILPIRQSGWGAVSDSLLFALYQRSMDSGVDWNRLLREANQIYYRLADANAQPTYAARMAALAPLRDQLVEMEQKTHSLGWVILASWLPNTRQAQVRRLILSTILSGSVSSIHESWTRGEVRRRVSPLGCAIERYRRANGTYPPNLETLVPEFIDKLPLDPYTDGPFHYRVNGDRSQFAVFSFGPNEKDDKGANWSEGGDDMGMHSPGWLATTLEP